MNSDTELALIKFVAINALVVAIISLVVIFLLIDDVQRLKRITAPKLVLRARPSSSEAVGPERYRPIENPPPLAAGEGDLFTDVLEPAG